MPAALQEINMEPLTNITLRCKVLRPNPTDTTNMGARDRTFNTSVAAAVPFLALAAGEITTSKISGEPIPTPLGILTFIFGAAVLLRVIGTYLRD